MTKRLVQTWIGLVTPWEIPWTPLSRPLEESTMALISSAGLALKTDRPVDREGERLNPWWGDPSYRVLPRTATEKDMKLYHLHIHPRVAEQDVNAVLPLQRLLELKNRREIGRSAADHYSFIGYILQPQVLLEQSVPRLAAIEHPLGYLLRKPGDQAGQTDVLRATLNALAEMTRAGYVSF